MYLYMYFKMHIYCKYVVYISTCICKYMYFPVYVQAIKIIHKTINDNEFLIKESE